MSDGKLFIKTKSSEIKAEIDQAYKKSRPHSKIKLILKKVTANIILNNHELSRLLPDMVKLLRFDDLDIRKVCLDYLCNYAHYDPVKSQEALPFLRRFKDDSSPLLRALAIQTLSTVNIPEYVDLSFSSVNGLLQDPNPYVRKAAAYAVVRLFQNNRPRVINENLISDLNELLYDDDDSVIGVGLSCLHDITESEKSLDLTIDLDHSIVLLKRMGKSSEWSQSYIINSLMSYVPQTSQSALELIELLMPFLQHENSSIVLNTIKVIVYLSNYVKNPNLIIPSLPKRLGLSLVSLLSKPPEIQFLVLRNVILLLLGRKELVHFDVEMFFCKQDDVIYVKDTKLEIIYLLANESNVMTVLRELDEYATEVDVAMARKAIRAFGNLAVKIVPAAQSCVEILVDLIGHGVPYIVQESAVVLKNIVRRYPNAFDHAVIELAKHYQMIEEADARAAMIWILGQFCTLIDDSIEIFEEMTETFKEDPLEVSQATLTCAVKMYLNYPEKANDLVLRLLKWATEEADNPDLRERGFFYWRLISTNNASGEFQALAKETVLNDKPLINSEQDNMNPKVLEDLELNIGTLASIYLKPVQQVFRLARAKTLAQSPALQPYKPHSPTSKNASTDNLHHDHKIYGQKLFANSHERLNRRHSTLQRTGSFESRLSDESGGTKTSLSKRISRRASILRKPLH